MKTRNELEGLRASQAPAGSFRKTSRVVLAAVVLFLATVVVALVLTFRGTDSSSNTPAPAPAPPVTTEYYGAPAD